MDYLYKFFHIGLFGVSYLYWAIMAICIAITTLFIRIHPFALPRDPSNWMIKKFIFHYFHSAAWMIIAWVFYRLHRRDGEFTLWLGILSTIACILLLIFLAVWIFDRYRIRKMKENK